MIWLNLGCGNNPLPKPWLNIDKYYYPAHNDLPATELMNRADGNPEDFDWIQGDFTTELVEYADNAVDKINLCHSLEHVSWEDAMKTIIECHRILKPKGTIEIEVPDLGRVYQFDFMTMIDLIYGGRDNNVYWGGHFCGFDVSTLTEIMEGFGFKKVERIDVGFGTSHPEPDRNFRLKGVK